MSGVLQNVNRIPVQTWSWLNVNAASLRAAVPPRQEYRKNPLAEGVPPGVDLTAIELSSALMAGYPAVPGAGDEVRGFIEQNSNSGFFIHLKGQALAQPISLFYDLDDDSPVLLDNTFILAEEGCRATVVIRYAASGARRKFHGGLTRVYVEKDAELRLIKVQALRDEDSNLDQVGVGVEGGAKVQVILAELGARQSIANCQIDLRGEKSGAELYPLYLGDGARELDLNYRVAHLAKETVSSIQARGALLDESKKVFRGTLDFVTGASGAKGREEEYTVLLSPRAINISTPLLLCGEDEVEGAHAASIGKLAESKLFYLMTRGLSATAAKKIMVEASFAPVLEKIPDRALREEILAGVRGRLSRV